MKTTRLNLLRGLLAALLLTGAGVAVAETNRLASGSTPASLVKAALESELAGPSDVRNQLLGQALKADPDFAPARWQSGFVRFGDQWVKVDDVPKHTADDKQLAAYRKMRDGLIDTADNHRALARWCHKNKLSEEERIHWAKILAFDRRDAEALSGLGLQLFNGQLLTRTQIEQVKIKAGDRLRAMQNWQPQFVKWRTAIEVGTGKSHDEAVEKLKGVSEPEAIPALEAVFALNGHSKKSAELNQLLIETMGHLQDDAAARVLVRRAIVSDSREVRSAAAKSLRSRPKHTFVPLFLAALPPTDIRSQHEVYVLPDGTVVQEHELFVEGAFLDRHRAFRFEDRPGLSTPGLNQQTGDVSVEPFPYAGFRTGPNVDSRLHQIASQVTVIENQLERGRQFNQELQTRIEAALLASTDFKKAASPQDWLNQWNDYNESYVPRLTGKEQVSEDANLILYTISCFKAGTPILTNFGMMPIEKIKAGDQVLSQNPETGELAYKIVQGVTLRPAAPLVKIGLGSATISATRGHPFWVNGDGWRMAKQLKVGQYLHSLAGAVLIDSIEEAPATEAYNLVVSDFDTYFVGERRVLVHDNLPIQSTTARVPGCIETANNP